MCGITLSIYPVPAPQSPQSHAHKHILAIHDSLAQSNAHRGPDTSDTFTLVVDVDGGQVELRLTSSVLGLRGELTGQPVRGDRGVLAWNGQVFHGLDIKQDENDTMAIMRELEAGRDVHELLASIEGPYAFVYYEYATQTLTYQLDLLSRRALLQHLPRSAHASSSSSLSSTTSSPISSSTSPHESSTTPEALASNSATDLAKATSTSASASTAVPPVAVSNSSSSSSSNGENIACIADRYFALSSTRSRAARNAGLAFRALGGGEGGVVDVKRIRICQPGGAGDGAAAGAGAGAEVVGGDMDMSAAMRSWESHGLSTPFTRIPPLNTTLPPSDYTPTPQAAESEVGRFIEELTASVMRRVINIPAARAGCARAALLFSGGVDSTLLAYMLHKCLPHNEPIDLVNVAFQRNPDLPVDNNKFQKDKGKNKDKDRKPTKGAGPGAKTRSRGDRYPGLATAPPPSDVGSELGGSRGAVGSAEVPVPVAAMGALDLTGASTSPISTPNAEQDAPSAAPTQGQGTKSNKQKEGEKLPNGLTEAEHARILAEHEYNVPDRIAGYEAVDELRRCCEGREFRFVTVDVTYAEYMAHREQVMDLMYPCTTEMDMSLAYPLYFASRGVGTVDGEPYAVQAKVYFSGLGPDEQLGGYSRHRHAYLYPSYPSPSPEADPAPDTAAPGHTAAPGAPTSTSPIPIPSPTQTQRYTSLLSSLHSELARLPTRNTSRDDRALSHWARDARYPYLDLQFIAYLSGLPIQAKVVYELGEGEGDKLLLRLAAQRVGLERSARRVKRAMQFGSRSAKVGGKGKGPGAGRREVGDE